MLCYVKSTETGESIFEILEIFNVDLGSEQSYQYIYQEIFNDNNIVQQVKIYDIILHQLLKLTSVPP